MARSWRYDTEIRARARELGYRLGIVGVRQLLDLRVGPLELRREPQVVGRRGADLLIEHRGVSKRHCEVWLDGEGVPHVRDLSKNGTLVEGALVRGGQRALAEGATLGFLARPSADASPAVLTWRLARRAPDTEKARAKRVREEDGGDVRCVRHLNF